MLIGDPEKLAFLIEPVLQWSSNGFVNGLLYVYVNGNMFPKDLRTTTLSDDLLFLLSNSPFVSPKSDNELYALDSKDLLDKLSIVTFPDDINIDNDYSYLIPLVELQNAKYYFFIIANEKDIKILVSKANGHNGEEALSLKDEVVLKRDEFEDIKQQLCSYYNNYIMQL